MYLRRKRDEVDRRHLANLVVRRCKDCDNHEEVIERFLGNYGEDIRHDVGRIVRKELSRPRTVTDEPPEWRLVDGATLCNSCSRRFFDHPPDRSWPWLTILCDGSRVKVS